MCDYLIVPTYQLNHFSEIGSKDLPNYTHMKACYQITHTYTIGGLTKYSL